MGRRLESRPCRHHVVDEDDASTGDAPCAEAPPQVATSRLRREARLGIAAQSPPKSAAPKGTAQRPGDSRCQGHHLIMPSSSTARPGERHRDHDFRVVEQLRVGHGPDQHVRESGEGVRVALVLGLEQQTPQGLFVGDAGQGDRRPLYRNLTFTVEQHGNLLAATITQHVPVAGQAERTGRGPQEVDERAPHARRS